MRIKTRKSAIGLVSVLALCMIVSVAAEPTSSLISGPVLYENSGECYNPSVNVTNMNTRENLQAEPIIIPVDTDNEPLWGETTELMVNVSGDSNVDSVIINLSSIVGKSITYMNNKGNYSEDSVLWCIFNYTTNASKGSAFEGGSYVPYLLQVNATDIYGISNTSVSIEVIVMENGDVNEDGSVNFVDVTYLANHVVGTSGYGSMEDNVADVSGDGSVNFVDVTFLANHVVGTSGYEKLK